MKYFSFRKIVECGLILSVSLLCSLSCGRDKDSSAVTANGWSDDTEANSILKVALPGKKTLEMIKIKQGSFKMGVNYESTSWYPTVLEQEVSLQKEFWLGKYEVTQEQWMAVMKGEKSADGTDLTSYPVVKNGYKKHPVANVSWDDAKLFCKKLNIQYEGKLPEGYFFDIPTVDQWEYACRAGTAERTYWGDDSTKKGMTNIPSSEPKLTLGELSSLFIGGNFIRREIRTNKVGSFPPNPWGFYDMFGNVAEMCENEYCHTTHNLTSDGYLEHFVKGFSCFNECSLEQIDASTTYYMSSGIGYVKTDRRSVDIGFRLALVSRQSIINKTAIQKTISNPTLSMNISESASNSKVLSLLPGVSMRLNKIYAGKTFQTGTGTIPEINEKDAALSSRNLKSKLNKSVHKWVGEQDWSKVLNRLPFEVSLEVTPSKNDFETNLMTTQGSPVPTSDYWITETEVTQEQWMAIMGNNPSYPSFQPELPKKS